jgi:hypothetical protein
MTNLQLIKRLIEKPLDAEIYIQSYYDPEPLTDIVVQKVAESGDVQIHAVILR